MDSRVQHQPEDLCKEQEGLQGKLWLGLPAMP